MATGNSLVVKKLRAAAGSAEISLIFSELFLKLKTFTFSIKYVGLFDLHFHNKDVKLNPS